MKLAVLAGLVAACGPKPAPVPQSPPPVPVAHVDAGVDAPEAPPVNQEDVLAAVQKAMTDLDPVAHQCWAAAAVERFDIEGDFEARIEIGNGAPAHVEVVVDTTRNKKLAGCMTSVLAQYPWAPPLKGQAIQLPFKFKMPDGQSVVDRALVPWAGQGKLSVAVLLDEANTGNDAASMVELAIAAGGTTGLRTPDRDELWVFLGDMAVGKREVHAGDVMVVPKGTAREVSAKADAHAIIAMVPGGREGTARAGALPTPEASATAKIALQVFPAGQPVKSAHFEVTALDIPAGGGPAEHVHDKQTELLYMQAGGGTMTVGGTKLPVTATSAVQVPKGTKHSFTASDATHAIRIYVQ